MKKDEYLKCKLWGGFVNIEIDYGCYLEEHIQPSQKNTYKDFIEKNSYYDSKDDIIVLDSIELEKAKQETLEYLKNEYGLNLEIIEKDILKHVSPFRLTVPENNKEKQVFIKFENVYDDEHGLAIEFIDNKFVRVGDLDISLV